MMMNWKMVTLISICLYNELKLDATNWTDDGNKECKGFILEVIIDKMNAEKEYSFWEWKRQVLIAGNLKTQFYLVLAIIAPSPYVT